MRIAAPTQSWSLGAAAMQVFKNSSHSFLRASLVAQRSPLHALPESAGGGAVLSSVHATSAMAPPESANISAKVDTFIFIVSSPGVGEIGR
jgi:hypothetical protein